MIGGIISDKGCPLSQVIGGITADRGGVITGDNRSYIKKDTHIHARARNWDRRKVRLRRVGWVLQQTPRQEQHGVPFTGQWVALAAERRQPLLSVGPISAWRVKGSVDGNGVAAV